MRPIGDVEAAAKTRARRRAIGGPFREDRAHVGNLIARAHLRGELRARIARKHRRIVRRGRGNARADRDAHLVRLDALQPQRRTKAGKHLAAGAVHIAARGMDGGGIARAPDHLDHVRRRGARAWRGLRTQAPAPCAARRHPRRSRRPPPRSSCLQRPTQPFTFSRSRSSIRAVARHTVRPFSMTKCRSAMRFSTSRFLSTIRIDWPLRLQQRDAASRFRRGSPAQALRSPRRESAGADWSSARGRPRASAARRPTACGHIDRAARPAAETAR